MAFRRSSESAEARNRSETREPKTLAHAVGVERRKDEVTNSVIFDGELSVFLDAAEERGVVGESELDTLAFEHDLDEEELGALRAELAVREIEIAVETRDDEAGTPRPEARLDTTPGATVGTTDSLTLFMNRARAPRAALGSRGGLPREARSSAGTRVRRSA